MAVVTESLTYSQSYTPFETPPQAATQFSLVPRGVRRFFFNNDVALKPVNDQLNLFLTANLPENFAYILTRFNYQLTADTASDWDRQLELRMFNHIPGQELGNSEHVHAQLTLMVPASFNPQLTVDTVDLTNFAGPFWGPASFRVFTANVAAAAAAASFLISHCEFLEYDLAQAQRYFINTRIPVM